MENECSRSRSTKPMPFVDFVRIVARTLVFALFICAAIAMWWQSGQLWSTSGALERIALRLIAPALCLLPCFLYIAYLWRSRRK